MTSLSPRRPAGVALALLILAATGCTEQSEAGTHGPGQVEGIPGVVLDAYQEAAAAAEEIAPECSGMRWSILAGIGQEESDHGTLGGSEMGADGVADPPILGPALNGGEFAAIPDTDGGRYDKDTEWDRAVGPMQFIPATWEAWAPEATGKEEPDPQNVFDATRTAVAYVCGQDPVDLDQEESLRERLMAYNQSQVYVDDVMANIEEYDSLPTDAPAAATGAVEEVGEVVGCEVLGTPNVPLVPQACQAHEMINQVFGGFYLSAGGVRGEQGSDHGHGEAVDYMVAPLGQKPSDRMHAQTQVVVQYMINNHEALGVKGLIYEQRIWNKSQQDVGAWPEVGRPMADRGDNTQNHFDHIHMAAGPSPMR